ncbi:MAG: glucose-6-phosphate isomerase [Coxiellaceae bacterium]|nr:glucose-6-phosphate isomerase [Coxiellaceae bacterium]
MSIVSNKPIWHLLQEHSEQMQSIAMRDLFLADSDRSKKFSLQACGISLDYSKNRLTLATRDYLTQLAELQQVPQAIEELFSGGLVNASEQRPALHTLLRTPSQSVSENLQSESDQISVALEQMNAISSAVEKGDLLGFTGKQITDVINIGIGGSDLGPLLLFEALKPQMRSHLNLHFLSTCDKAFVNTVLSRLNPETTLVVVVSKSFTTQETLLNYAQVKSWMLQHALDWSAIQHQWFAVTASHDKAVDSGFNAENILPIWDWVGGRYSIWSSVCLSVVIVFGMEIFNQFLAGGHAMDLHVRQAPLSKNMPVILALLGIWYQNFLDAKTHLVVPYSCFLSGLPRYLQQLFMESQGKRVTQHGEPVEFSTGSIIWGECGTNSQHSFHQLLMQGTHTIPVDFILPKQSYDGSVNPVLTAHALAQSQVLMEGLHDVEAHQEIPGNVPSNFLMLERLDATHLGALLALYEHIVYIQSVIWGTNAFDQWGVERGKVMAKGLLHDLEHRSVTHQYDSSTESLLNQLSLSSNGVEST